MKVDRLRRVAAAVQGHGESKSSKQGQLYDEEHAEVDPALTGDEILHRVDIGRTWQWREAGVRMPLAEVVEPVIVVPGLLEKVVKGGEMMLCVANEVSARP